VRNNYEDFFNLSVEVKNNKTLYESLEKYVSGDMISDYYCETCEKKVDVIKTNCISALPNVLIVHLQRIIFNFDTYMNQKINSRLQFPRELNLYPYTEEALEKKRKTEEEKEKESLSKELKPLSEEEEVISKREENNYVEGGIEKEEKMTGNENNVNEEIENRLKDEEVNSDNYHYNLAGVIVHDGTADEGHYYSYINTIRCNPAKRDPYLNYLPVSGEKWLEFNDSSVRSFE
jgi:uncharacterized UBP type Zn finger protein